jgi:competence protein ComEC
MGKVLARLAEPTVFTICKFIALAYFLFAFSCSRVNVVDEFPACTFSVVNVGQGLSQIVTSQGAALIFDVGDSGENASWQATYEQLGSPAIGAIVVSHTHVDHMGGLSKLQPSLAFSGNIITHPNEDTAYIRRRVSEDRRTSVYFTLLAQGDTVPGLAGVSVECIWPPREIDTSIFIDTRKNRYSMCFLLTCGSTKAFITSDIDTGAERTLSSTYGFGLKSDLLVVPHHGSASSADPVFFGFVNPDAAIISCGNQNAYGFPSQRGMDIIFQMRLEVHRTDLQGSVIAFSNGYYWEWR